jgi:hypothetical protein
MHMLCMGRSGCWAPRPPLPLWGHGFGRQPLGNARGQLSWWLEGDGLHPARWPAGMLYSMKVMDSTLPAGRRAFCTACAALCLAVLPPGRECCNQGVWCIALWQGCSMHAQELRACAVGSLCTKRLFTSRSVPAHVGAGFQPNWRAVPKAGVPSLLPTAATPCQCHLPPACAVSPFVLGHSAALLQTAQASAVRPVPNAPRAAKRQGNSNHHMNVWSNSCYGKQPPQLLYRASMHGSHTRGATRDSMICQSEVPRCKDCSA